MPGKQPEPSPFPIGHQRDGWPNLWGWAEFVAASGRADNGLRHMRTAFADEFPEPLAVIGLGPIFLEDECVAFLTEHPKREPRAQLSERDQRRIYLLNDNGVPNSDIAEVVGCTPMTVYRYLRKRRR